MEVRLSITIEDIDRDVLSESTTKTNEKEPYLLFGLIMPNMPIDNSGVMSSYDESMGKKAESLVIRVPLVARDIEKREFVLSVSNESMESIYHTIKKDSKNYNSSSPFNDYVSIRSEMAIKALSIFAHVHRYVPVEQTNTSSTSPLLNINTEVTQRVSEKIITTYHEHRSRMKKLAFGDTGNPTADSMKIIFRDVLGEYVCKCSFSISAWKLEPKYSALYDELIKSDVYFTKLFGLTKMTSGDEKRDLVTMERSSKYRRGTQNFYEENQKEYEPDDSSNVFRYLNNIISRYQNVYEVFCYNHFRKNLDFPYEWSTMVYVFSNYSFYGLSPLPLYLQTNTPLTSIDTQHDDKKQQFISFDREKQEKAPRSYWCTKNIELFFLRLLAYCMTLRQTEMFFNRTESGDSYLGWEYWMSMGVNDKMAILIDVISICSGSTMYLSDFSIQKQFMDMKQTDKQNANMKEGQTSRIGIEDFYTVSEGSGDCEDLAMYIYTMFMNMAKSSAHFALNDLSRLSNYFIPFLCLNCVNAPSMNGMDKDSPKISGHMVMLLIRKKWFYAHQSQSNPKWDNSEMVKQMGSFSDLLLAQIQKFDKTTHNGGGGAHYKDMPENGHTLNDLYKWEMKNEFVDSFKDYNFDVYEAYQGPDVIRNIYICEGTAFLRQQPLYAIERYPVISGIGKLFSPHGGHCRYYDMTERDDVFYKQLYLAFSDYFFSKGVNLPWIHFTYENTKIYGVTHSALLMGKADPELHGRKDIQLLDNSRPIGDVKWTMGMQYPNFNQLYPYISLLGSFSVPSPPHKLKFNKKTQFVECIKSMESQSRENIQAYVSKNMYAMKERQNETGDTFITNDSMHVQQSFIDFYRKELKNSVAFGESLMNSEVCEPMKKVDHSQSIKHWYSDFNLGDILASMKDTIFDKVIVNGNMDRPWKNLCYMMVNAPNVLSVLQMHRDKLFMEKMPMNTHLAYIDEWRLIDGCQVYIFWYYTSDKQLQEYLGMMLEKRKLKK